LIFVERQNRELQGALVGYEELKIQNHSLKKLMMATAGGK
jgi:hypothetical protein